MAMRLDTALRARLSSGRLGSESGVSLIVTLAILVGVMILGGTAVKFSATNARSADRSTIRSEAVGIAESGMNLARSTLWQASDPTDPDAVQSQQVTIGDATVTYSGTYDSVNELWTLSGTASMASENPGAAPVTRTVTSQVQVTAGNTPDPNTHAAWSTIFVDDWQSCANVDDNAVIEVELYIRGDLCLDDDAFISHLAGRVQVWGNIDIEDNGQIGTNLEKLPELHVGGGCRNDQGSGNFHTPCTPADSVYPGTFSTSPENITMPPMDLDYWYANAKPGPLYPCNNGTSLPPGVVFDDNPNPISPVADESNSTFELTTAAAYDCQYWEGGEMVGRLAWTGGTVGTLTVLGTLFFDGDIHLPQSVGVRADYNGQASLYTSGEIEVELDVWLCGVAACDATWDPDTDLLVLIADGGGEHEGVDVEKQGKFQGGIFSMTEIDISKDGEFWGSAITRRTEFVQGTVIKQIPGGVFPILEGMPQTTSTEPGLANVGGSYTVANG
ncbi:MAG: hypothetical protein ACR2OD_00610 [Gaiellaceae bacterium]